MSYVRPGVSGQFVADNSSQNMISMLLEIFNGRQFTSISATLFIHSRFHFRSILFITPIPFQQHSFHHCRYHFSNIFSSILLPLQQRIVRDEFSCDELFGHRCQVRLEQSGRHEQFSQLPWIANGDLRAAFESVDREANWVLLLLLDATEDCRPHETPVLLYAERGSRERYDLCLV